MRNQSIGNKGESLAAKYLVEKGFEIIERNWRYKYVEIDIIASRQNVLHFVEVKTRTSTKFGHPEEAVTKKKMEQLKIGAEVYQLQNPQWKYIQFDVLGIQLANNGEAQYWFNKDVYF